MSELTAQSVFDTTARHLRSMRRPSKMYGRGMYRGYDGARCAVGVHLTDEECQLPEDRRGLFVDPRMTESTGFTLDALGYGDVTGLMEQNLLPERLVPHVRLLAALQVAHDSAWNWMPEGGVDVSRMGKDLLRIAEGFLLDPSIVTELY
jgi:hypothetical protein